MARQLSLLGAEAATSAGLPDRLRAVESMDWNFHAARTQQGLHGVHPYPAKFIPQLPRQLISLLHPGDGPVLDPFCGSGTALVEAQALGHQAIGIDLNPLASLIARVKTRPPRAILQHATEVLRGAVRSRAQVPDIPRLDHWFTRPVQEALAALVASIRRVGDLVEREGLELALSSIVVRVSNQESDTRYAAVSKPGVDRGYVFDAFERAARDIDRAVREQTSAQALDALPSARVITKDVLDVRAEDIGRHTAGLVVTSPPYPNAYEYWLYHKYRMYWLGMDPIAVRANEIGARPHYFKKNHHTAADFERQMGAVFAMIAKVLRSDGLACFVVGRSIIHGEVIDNEALLARAAKQSGFRTLVSVARSIPTTRKAFNPVHGSINREAIMVFGR